MLSVPKVAGVVVVVIARSVQLDAEVRVAMFPGVAEVRATVTVAPPLLFSPNTVAVAPEALTSRIMRTGGVTPTKPWVAVPVTVFVPSVITRVRVVLSHVAVIVTAPAFAEQPQPTVS